MGKIFPAFESHQLASKRRFALIQFPYRLILSLSFVGLAACSQAPIATVAHAEVSQTSPSLVDSSESPAPAADGETRTPGDLTLLFSKIWRVTNAPTEHASGSIYVFLPNGTLLQTSCVETYRISTWLTPNVATPDILQVTEDGQVAYTAEILELTNTTLRLQQTLVRSGETQEITLSAIDTEFVCPDLPR